MVGCWLIATGGWEPTSKTIAGTGGFLGFYLSQWGKLSDWYFRVPLWIMFGLLVIFTLKFPAYRLCKWIIGCIVSKVRALPVPDVKMPSVKIKMPSVSLPSMIEKPLKTVSKMTEKTVKEVEEKAPKENPKEIKGKAKSLKNSKCDFVLPSSGLLEPAKTIGATITADTMRKVSEDLEAVLAQFGVSGKIVGANPGPVVTLYEFEPASGIKTSRVIALSEDIAREMRALSVRIAVVPGSNTIGIEMPNAKRDTVYIRELVESVKFGGNTGALPLILGKNIGGV
ncbi:MAG: hypothetical protein IKL32_00360, partial [Alphaproteobacteria bacterium]|nr:hypothetical protein [Alphaproteobacteria bacterium]